MHVHVPVKLKIQTFLVVKRKEDESLSAKVNVCVEGVIILGDCANFMEAQSIKKRVTFPTRPSPTGNLVHVPIAFN